MDVVIAQMSNDISCHYPAIYYISVQYRNQNYIDSSSRLYKSCMGKVFLETLYSLHTFLSLFFVF